MPVGVASRPMGGTSEGVMVGMKAEDCLWWRAGIWRDWKTWNAVEYIDDDDLSRLRHFARRFWNHTYTHRGILNLKPYKIVVLLDLLLLLFFFIIIIIMVVKMIIIILIIYYYFHIYDSSENNCGHVTFKCIHLTVLHFI